MKKETLLPKAFVKRNSITTNFMLLPVLLTLSLLETSCSKVEFKSQPNNSCVQTNQQYGSDACTTSNGYNVYSYSLTTGKVDILFVVDNSRSMYTEQTEMANRFSGLASSINSLDWQIAVTTTDISTSPNNSTPNDANGSGTLQDGKLIYFPNGSKFIRKSDSNTQSQFEQTIMRPETQVCEANGSPCPSNDERGIYAANLAVELASTRGNVGSNRFFRPDAHLAIVILSDEDERSNGGNIANDNGLYDLQTRDLPETLVRNVESSLGPGKIFSVHPIIVKPTDSSCNSQEKTQAGTSGSFDRYGNIYAELATPNSALQALGNIVDGHLGDICATNYTSELGDMGQIITQNVSIIQLACAPINLEVRLNDTLQGSSAYYVDSSNRLHLTPAASAGIQVSLNYKCNNTAQ